MSSWKVDKRRFIMPGLCIKMHWKLKSLVNFAVVSVGQDTQWGRTSGLLSLTALPHFASYIARSNLLYLMPWASTSFLTVKISAAADSHHMCSYLRPLSNHTAGKAARAQWLLAHAHTIRKHLLSVFPGLLLSSNGKNLFSRDKLIIFPDLPSRVGKSGNYSIIFIE